MCIRDRGILPQTADAHSHAVLGVAIQLGLRTIGLLSLIHILNYVDLLREVGACFSVNNMLRAECYKQRMEKGLSFLEFNYMIMQSYDFYYMFQHNGCNMQFGGNDQWSNMLGGTELIRRKLGKDAHAMTITLLTDSQGNKMGKMCIRDRRRASSPRWAAASP